MKTFTTGNMVTYSRHWLEDYGPDIANVTYAVVKRTKTMITLQDDDGEIIKRKVKLLRDIEYVEVNAAITLFEDNVKVMGAV